MPRRPWRCVVAGVVLGGLLLGCGAADGRGDAGDAAPPPDEVRDEPAGEGSAAEESAEPVVSVVATVAPVADLVRMIGGDRVAVASLVPAGADSHTYEPRPQDVARLSEADAYVGIGLDLNPGALQLAEQNVGDGVPVVLLGEVALGDDDLVLDHGHGDDAHGHSHGDDDHTHAHDPEELGPNPHVWTSLRNAAAMLDGIVDTLTRLDPDGAEHYERNGTAARDELTSLDRLIGDAIATIPDDDRTLVTYHDAWTYFARDHDLEFVTAVQPADFSEPSAAEVRAVIELIRDRDVPAVFGSEVFPTPVLEAIAEETGAIYVGDLADDALPGGPGDPEHTYLELMRRNAAAIVSGLGGDASQLEGQ